MTYEHAGAGALDYLSCGYGQSRLQFRGPERSLERKYAAFIGGTETYGKFVARPFPSLIEDMTGVTAVNLGVVNAGIETFRSDQTVLQIARGAEFVVLQVMGPEYVSNRYYTVHSRRNDRFIRASGALHELYPEVDFTEFHFVGHLLHRLRRVSAKKFSKVIGECRREWLTSCAGLLHRVGRPTLVLWLPRHAQPRSIPDDFVNDRLLAPLGKRCAALVEVTPNKSAISDGTAGMVFGQMEAFAAADLPNPKMHNVIAETLHRSMVRVGLD
ncbi:MAG: DUF6473 family protein [Thalassovita sp.]